MMTAQSSGTPMLGMYIHQHWGYHHPYSARTWTVEDWRGYAAGLTALGYNMISIWPVMEIIPDPLTPSDRAHLQKLHDVIDMLHEEFGMTVFVTLGPNVIANDNAAKYTFEERPYFECDRRLKPSDPAEMGEFYRIRRRMFSEFLHGADGFVTIDSDPGGYVGSTNAEFVAILRELMKIIREVNPDAFLYYWMWIGWETYNRFWEDALAGKTKYNWSTIEQDCDAAVRMLNEHPEEPWRLFCCMNDVHKPIIERHGLQARTLHNPYGLIEGEPTFPLTNYLPANISEGLAAYDRELTQLGVLANAQTHILQLPNTYIYAHLAKGGTLETLDLPGFAEELIPGCGAVLAPAWVAMGGEDSARMRALAAQLSHCDASSAAGGRFAGFLFGDPAQYVADLIMQLIFRADMVDFSNAQKAGTDLRAPLRALVASLKTWQAQTGFADAYYGPFVDYLHAGLKDLHDPAIDQVIIENEDFLTPEDRHGVVPRLIAAMEGYLAAKV
ncbi:MAG TPA: hypothetical protein VGL77_08175 [Armatimonadota bacterium]